MSPPCSTFSAARGGPTGPQPLRGIQGKEIYGLKSLRPEETKKVKEGTILAVHTRDTAMGATLTKKPWILEQPKEKQDKPSMFKMEEFKALEAMDGGERYSFAQCRFGCEFEKMTDLLSNVELGPEFKQKCNHPPKWWRVPWNGKRIWAPHPPLRGKQVAIEEHLWDPGMLRNREPQGEYITRQAAAYPAEMNRALASALAAAATRSPGASAEGDKVTAPKNYEPDPKPSMVIKLGEIPISETQHEDMHSLRNVKCWVTNRMMYIGVQVRNIIERAFDSNPNTESMIWKNFDSHQKPEDVEVPESWLDEVRSNVIQLFQRNMPNEDLQGVADLERGIYDTKIRGKLLRTWAKLVEDPGTQATRWLFEGAPAGLSMDSSALDGMFPEVVNEDEDVNESLETDFDSFQNYAGIEEDLEAFEALETYYKKGFLQKFNSLQEVEAELGCRPTLSKLGCIKRMNFNVDTNEYTYKARIILDCKRSGVSRMAKRTHKSVLPRVTDAILSSLELMAQRQDDQQLQLFIADIVNAFWLIPLHIAE